MAPVTGPGLIDALVPVLRGSLERLERVTSCAESPLAELRLATLLHAQAALLGAIAAELEARAHEDLGRFGAEVVEEASRAVDAETAACAVAEAFLKLGARTA